MLAIIGGSGKIGGATLSALLSESLLPSSQIICTTSATSSSDSRWTSLASTGVTVRHATFDSPTTLVSALHGATALYLVSTPVISMDFNNAPHGSGREKHHFAAIDAAVQAGVKHIYYTSLAFANPSKAGVMQAHMRTEAYLKKVQETKGVDSTVLREGLYNESWPLYFGHYDVAGDERTTVKVGGDSKISWTGIADLGLANALVLVAPREEWKGRTVYLSNTKEPRTIAEVAAMVSKAKGRDVGLEVVSRQEHERYYVQERKMGKAMIEWWASTYDALRDQECLIKDDTFDTLLASKGRTPKRVEDTVSEMIQAAK
ncbi:hypothetical protein MBLNU457_g0103t1 [Dothideomycetes sp. NU457]